MNKEEIYDTQISPLMTQILGICKENRIALICDFGLDEDLHCTSALMSEEYSPSSDQLKAWALLKPKQSFAFAETTQTMPDGTKRISIRRIS